MSITAPLRQHHHHCDELFSLAEAGAATGDWTANRASLTDFIEEMTCHFCCEEDTLFPAFEAATGMTQGPTQVMRLEHQQMRGLMDQMLQAWEAQDEDAFTGAAETLLIFMQQHNMKEENILYPMCDQHVSGDIGEQVSTALHCAA